MIPIIDEYHPKYTDFLKNEVKTLGEIQGLSPLKSIAPSLVKSAELKYNFYKEKVNPVKKGRKKEKKKSQNQLNHKFTFSCDFDLDIEGKEHKVILESLILPGFEMSTYAFSICRENNTMDNGLEIIRKYHFDYAPTNQSFDRKSKYHLQFAGKSTPRLNELGVSVGCLHPYLSVPRLDATPMNLAILLDIVFCECYSEKTMRLIEKDEWRNLVKYNEDFLLKDFYKNIYFFFSGKHHKSNFLYRDLKHGKTK